MKSSFEVISEFISNKMRMSHIYQPVMLIKLLRGNGIAAVNQIAQSLLSYDASQVEYYEHITKNMVGKVLTKNRGITTREGSEYTLNGFDSLSQSEIEELIQLCESKIDAYLEKRSDPWGHRKKSSGYIPGTLRYKILSRAKFRCELCGISADKKSLEVDHIIPRNKGGLDDESNLQSLCYSCNAMKRDRDDTDFRGMADTYSKREKGCVFCELPKTRIIEENELAIAFEDNFPVTSGHTLVIPKRHIDEYFGLYQPERNAIQKLLESSRERILRNDKSVTGFNIGNNSGESAGQTIFHCHTHLIPRRDGDCVDPKGGVRGVIANKQKY
jgi:ATP adenylyltransferase